MKPVAGLRGLSGPLGVVVTVFAVSRIVFFSAGLRFDVSPLQSYRHFLDIELLRSRLFESTLYLHAQPPAFNLFLGSVLKLFPGREVAAFHLVYLLCGLVLAVSLLLLMVGLGTDRWLAALLVILFIAGPSAVLYENWLFYTYPVTALLCVSALCLDRLLVGGKVGSAANLGLVLAALALTWSLLNVIWLLLLLGLFIWHRGIPRRYVALAMGLPLLLVGLLHAKNLYLFASFSGSTWAGMNLARITTFQLPLETRRSLVQRGELSTVALVEPLSPLSDYPSELTSFPPAGVPAVDLRVKSNGSANLNNGAYIGLSRRYLRDALHVLRHHPTAYGVGLLKAYAKYFRPASDCDPLRQSAARIARYESLYSLLAQGVFRFNYTEPSTAEKTIASFHEVASLGTREIKRTGWFLVVAFPLLWLYGLRLAVRCRQETRRAFMLAFFLLNITYISLIGNSTDPGQNNRYRFAVSPFYLTLLGLFLNSRVNGRLRVTESEPVRRGARPVDLTPERRAFLAGLLQQGEDTALLRPLVEAQPGNPLPPFFCVSGSPALARSLGQERPFYQVKLVLSLGRGEDPATYIRGLAARCVEAVRSVQPEGPYLLGGFCMGGVVAFEMAQQLRAAGQRVGLLVLLNTERPGERSRLTYWTDRLRYHLHKLRALSACEKLSYLVGKVRSVEARLGLQVSGDNQRERLFEANRQTIRRYTPRPYPGRISLFLSHETMAIRSFADWKELAAGGLDVEVVPGDHASMLREPDVLELAEKLRPLLNKV